MKVNMNTLVKVELTYDGLLIMMRKHTELNKLIEKNGGKKIPFPYKEDKEGYITIELWKLFEIFGAYLYNGSDAPFEGNEIIIAGD